MNSMAELREKMLQLIHAYEIAVMPFEKIYFGTDVPEDVREEFVLLRKEYMVLKNRMLRDEGRIL